MIIDHDSKFGPAFAAVAKGSGTKLVRTGIEMPKMNAIAERFIGGLRRECLDWRIIFNETQMQRILVEYKTYYNTMRPHQGIGQQIPTKRDHVASPLSGITATPVLGGLHHHDGRTA